MLKILARTRIVAALLVVIGVPLVLVGYILLDRAAPAARAAALRPAPAVAVAAPALRFLGVFLVYPTIATIVASAS